MVSKSTLSTARFACGFPAIDKCRGYAVALLRPTASLNENHLEFEGQLLQSARVSCKTSAMDRCIPHLTGAYR